MNEETQVELAGKVAVVTGVTRRAGLGAAIAREFVKAGAAVFTTHFREYDERQTWGVAPGEPESILSELGSRGAGIALDLSNPSAAVELFDRARARFGPVDILVNNAAHWEPGGIDRISSAQLDRHFAVNLRAAVLLCAEFTRRRRPGPGGRIINVTSGQGRAPMPGELAYAVTKAGLDALALSLAADLRTAGVTVNAIDPGPIDTGWMTVDLRASLAAASPAGRLARPEDLAAVVRLLCTDAAAAITGRVIRIQSEGAVEDLKTELASAVPASRPGPTQIPIGEVVARYAYDSRMADDDLVSVRTFMNHIEADLAQSALEAAGIESAISADDAGGTRPHLWVAAGVRLLVRRADAGRADEILQTPAKTD